MGDKFKAQECGFLTCITQEATVRGYEHKSLTQPFLLILLTINAIYLTDLFKKYFGSLKARTIIRIKRKDLAWVKS